MGSVAVFLAVLLALLGPPSHAAAICCPHTVARQATVRIDRQATLFGIECTFQDERMLEDLNTLDPYCRDQIIWETPYKREKLNQWVAAYAAVTGRNLGPLPPAGYKPGVLVRDERGNQIPVLMEPLIIEWAPRPVRYDEIIEVLTPVYESAARVGLVPYLLPGGMHSGGGEIHIGGKTLGDSPFARHPNLLRNLMVYVHQHPSLLYGFGEVFELGGGSSLDTYHSVRKKAAFHTAVRRFDAAYLAAPSRPSPLQRVMLLGEFLGFLDESPSAGLVDHDRFVNVDNLIDAFRGTHADARSVLAKKGKLTVELRIFRAARNPQQAKARVRMLLRLMDRLAAPGYLEPLRELTPEESSRFLTASKIAADWEEVRRDLGLADRRLDEQVEETVGVCHGERREVRLGSRTVELFPASSPRANQGRYFEVRLAAEPGETAPPHLRFGRDAVPLELLTLAGTRYWVGRLDAGSKTVRPEEVVARLRSP